MGGFRLGVDFGTSHTVAVLRWPDGRARPLLFDGSPVLPSAVSAAPAGGLLTGRDALYAARFRPEAVELHPKRCVDDGTVLLGDAEFAVVDLVAAVLRRVADEGVRVSGAPPPTVVTCPVSWGTARRALVAEAARRAGLDLAGLVTEPVAAASYFAEAGGERLGPAAAALVYDLGAGTFDASVVRRSPEGFTVLAVEGLPDTGGLDIDAAVVDALGEVYASRDQARWHRLLRPATASDARDRWLLWTDVRTGKEMLSRTATTAVPVPLFDDAAALGREELERLARPILDRTIRAARAALDAASVKPAELAGILLVGGGSRMPLAASLLHRAFGVAPTALEQPELVVAEGALYATPNPAPPYVVLPPAPVQDRPAVDPARATATLPTAIPPAATPPPGPAPAPPPVDRMSAPDDPATAAAHTATALAEPKPTSAPDAGPSPSPSPADDAAAEGHPATAGAGTKAASVKAELATEREQAPAPHEEAATVDGAAAVDGREGDAARGAVRAAGAGTNVQDEAEAATTTAVAVLAEAEETKDRRRHLVAIAVTVAVLVLLAALGVPSILDRGGRPEATRTQGPTSQPSASASAGSGGSVSDRLVAPALAVVFNPRDDNMLAAGGEDRVVRLWDVRKREVAAELRGYGGDVYHLAFSPDGRYLAVAGEVADVWLWDVRRRQRVAALKHPTDRGWAGVSDVAFSPDGKTLATVGADSRIRLWDVGTRRQKGGPLTGYPYYADRLSWSPDGTRLAFRDMLAPDDGVVIWDPVNRRQISQIKPPRTNSNALAFSPKAALIAIPVEVPSGGTVAQSVPETQLWDSAKGRKVASLRGSGGPVQFSADGRLLATGYRGLRVWDVSTRQLVADPMPIEKHVEEIAQDLAFSPDGKTLAVARKTEVRLVDVGAMTAAR
ncbi:Hsp70 family protein [Phytohabitans flavus]|uniref:Hsp70 family protein n=1 Tax=Phytohabitans flavus TaxID=1076124 RepID=UPI0031E5D30B